MRMKRTGLTFWALAVVLLAACSSTPARRPRAVPVGYEGAFTTWWSDDIVKEEGAYVAGRRHGEIEVFYKDGSPHMSGEFLDGKPHGELTTWHPGGAGVAVVEEFDHGVLDGERVVRAATTGVVVERTRYAGGVRDGRDERWRDDGSRVFEGRWARDLPVGRWRHWDPIGRLSREEHYWVTAGVPTGYLETVFASDGVTTAQTLMLRDGDEWAGRVTTWHDNGQQQSLVEYRGGERHGRDVSWDRGGRLVAEGRREHDLRTGSWTFFGKPGEGARTVVYADDEPVAPAPGEPAPTAPDGD